MSHRLAELRSIELHRAVAERIRDDAHIAERARVRVSSWINDGGPVPRATATAWGELLDGPREALLATLVEDSERAAELRQCTPFAGVIPERERQDIIRSVTRHAS